MRLTFLTTSRTDLRRLVSPAKPCRLTLSNRPLRLPNPLRESLSLPLSAQEPSPGVEEYTYTHTLNNPTREPPGGDEDVLRRIPPHNTHRAREREEEMEG